MKKRREKKRQRKEKQKSMKKKKVRLMVIYIKVFDGRQNNSPVNILATPIGTSSILSRARSCEAFVVSLRKTSNVAYRKALPATIK